MASVLTERLTRLGASSTMMEMLGERRADFRSETEMLLTAAGVDPTARVLAEREMDTFWSDIQAQAIFSGATDKVLDEVIIGSGYHAAVYAAVRVAKGFPKPLVLEASNRAGGTFAMTERPAFYLNSRNRPGSIGVAGDRRAALNYIPGAPIQAANLSGEEYQSNADMAFAIRTTLAECAIVATGTTVTGLDTALSLTTKAVYRLETNRGYVDTYRVIDARGLGAPKTPTDTSSNIYAFADFMRRMTGRWPLRNVRRIAVVGGGDSGKCAVESALGIGPANPQSMITALDNVERIDWYDKNLPDTCERWRQEVRGRYQQIGASLRPDRFGERRLSVIDQRALPVALPGQPLVNGRSYDLVVMCDGFKETAIAGLERSSFDQFTPAGSQDPVATKSFEYEAVYRVGPHANLPFSTTERAAGVADISNNKVAMFRTGVKTATLAATLS